MACAMCRKVPNTHSFTKFGRRDFASLFYTSPARSIDQDEANLPHFKEHLDETMGQPWVWVFDCGNMGFRHYTSIKFSTEIYNIIKEEHADSIEDIYILRSNMWIRTTLGILKALFNDPLLSKVKFIDSKSLETHGFSVDSISWLKAVLATHSADPLPGDKNYEV